MLFQAALVAFFRLVKATNMAIFITFSFFYFVFFADHIKKIILKGQIWGVKSSYILIIHKRKIEYELF